MNLRGTATPGQYLTGNINKMTYQIITAYGIAVKNGFEGTEEEWLDSLEVNPDAVVQAVNAYMAAHPVGVDTTLSVSGQAADAKATGDGLARLGVEISNVNNSVSESLSAVGEDIARLGEEISNVGGHAENKDNPHGVTAEQIGAAPSGFGLGRAVTINYSEIDNATSPGFYGVSGTATIAGITANYWYMFVYSYTDGAQHCTQELHPASGGDCHRKLQRQKQGGVWRDWSPIPIGCTTILTAGENLDNYTTAGWYYFKEAPTNIPGGVNGWLQVADAPGISVIKQLWYRLGTPGSNDYNTWVRTYSSNGGWGDWKQILTSAGGTITGTLHISNTTDGSSAADNNVALIVGNRSGEHIIIDTNEIIPKASGKTGGNLLLGDSLATITMNGIFALRSSYSYGTELPAAGKAGRVFFKKV